MSAEPSAALARARWQYGTRVERENKGKREAGSNDAAPCPASFGLRVIEERELLPHFGHDGAIYQRQI